MGYNLFEKKYFCGFLSVCSCGELNFTVILDSSLSSKVQQARSMRESFCFLIFTTVVAPQECYVLGSLFHQYLNMFDTNIADNKEGID